MDYKELAELVKAAQGGDNDAFVKIYEETHNKMYYYSVKVVGKDNAEDVLQNSYINLIKNINTINDPKAFVGWFKKVVYYECISINKKNGKYILPDDDEQNIFDALEDENMEFLPSDAFENVEKRQIILDAINKLPDAQKQTILMFYFDELTIKQIAEIIGTNENTVKSYLNYGRKKLEKALGEKKSKDMLAVVPFPLLLLILQESAKTTNMTQAQSTAVLSEVSTATGVSITSKTSASLSEATAEIATATTKATGLAVKIAALSISTKIIAGIVATTIVVGTISGAVLLNKNIPAQQTNSVVSETDKLSTEDITEDSLATNQNDVPSESDSVTDTSTPTTPDNVLSVNVAEKNIYAGTYRSAFGQNIEITTTEDGHLQYYGEDIDITNKQEEGSILAHEKYNEQIASDKMYIYPAGVELSAYDHSISSLVASDKSNIRVFLTFSDVPDINSNVYYKVELLKDDELSYLPKPNFIYEFKRDGVVGGQEYTNTTLTMYVESDKGEIEGDVVAAFEDGKSVDTKHFQKYAYFEDKTGLYYYEVSDFPIKTAELLIKYPLKAGQNFQSSNFYGAAKIESINETITTEAGVFDNVVVVSYELGEGGYGETKYFAPGAGIIKVQAIRSNSELIKISK